MGLITDLTAVADDILGVRDTLGAAIHDVYIVTRVWSGGEPGAGTATDTEVQMLPTPALKNLSHNFKALEAGNYKQGDLILKGVSKQSYTTEASVKLITGTKDTEKFYKVNDELYQVISVTESYITWDVQIRRISHS